MKTYTLEQYKSIDISAYTLPATILTILLNLSKELGVSNAPPSTYSHSTKTTNEYGFNETKEHNGKFNRHRSQPVNQTWEKVKPFKTTVIDKKEGIEKRVNDIRICLNKISNKNYDAQKDSIVQYIEELSQLIQPEGGEGEGEGGDQDLLHSSQQKIATAIFDIASANKFYSVLYATLYKDLIDRFSIFQEILGGFVELYLANIQLIEYVDPNVNYDKYCLNNKENDKRKAMSVFIVNLMKNGVLEKSQVLHVILQLQEKVSTYMETPNKLNEVEEITENIFLFITTAKDDYTLEDGSWRTIVDNVKACSQMKSKEHLSLSSRAVFKYMDILDKL